VCVLATTPDVREPLGTRHTTIGMWAHQRVRLHDPGMGRHATRPQGTLVTTGRVDVVLHASPPERPRQTSGRPCVGGTRLPAPETVFQNPETAWQKRTLGWYGHGERTLESCTATAVWSRSGADPSDTQPPTAMVSTDPTQTAEPIIRDVLTRWSLDGIGEEGRAHLGLETPRHWSDRALERSTPLRCGLSSLVTLCGQALHPDRQIPVAHAAWSRTSTATFRDVRAAVRRPLWGQRTCPTSPIHPDVVFVPHSTLESWWRAVCSWVGHGQSQAKASIALRQWVVAHIA